MTTRHQQGRGPLLSRHTQDLLIAASLLVGLGTLGWYAIPAYGHLLVWLDGWKIRWVW